jgi:hypothetical protein
MRLLQNERPVACSPLPAISDPIPCILLPEDRFPTRDSPRSANLGLQAPDFFSCDMRSVKVLCHEEREPLSIVYNVDRHPVLPVCVLVSSVIQKDCCERFHG